jgi:hypothetical protein
MSFGRLGHLGDCTISAVGNNPVMQCTDPGQGAVQPSNSLLYPSLPVSYVPSTGLITNNTQGATLTPAMVPGALDDILDNLPPADSSALYDIYASAVSNDANPPAAASPTTDNLIPLMLLAGVLVLLAMAR